MSFQSPRINLISTQGSRWRASSSQRNISNPYNLAIPPQYHRRHTDASPSRETTNKPDISTTNRFDVPVEPMVPEKAVLVAERPRGMYTSNSKSKSTIFSYHQAIPYQPPPRKTNCAPSVNDRMLAMGVTLTLALFLAIGIPLAAILPRKMTTPLPINVLIPMCFKPDSGSWNRLHDTSVIPHPVTMTIVRGTANVSFLQRHQIPRNHLHRRHQSRQRTRKQRVADRKLH